MSLNKKELEKPTRTQGTAGKSNASVSTPSGTIGLPGEVSNYSTDELGIIHQQLEDIVEEMKLIMKKDDMIDLIKETVKSTINELTENIEFTIALKVEEKTKDLEDRVRHLERENTSLSNQLAETNARMKDIKDTDIRSNVALQEANYNEQYSRKNNIKIMGIQEKEAETEQELTETVSSLFDAKNIQVSPSKIVAIHRIPGRADQPKPILVKLANNNEKTKIMKNRKEFKEAGNRLVDDVTKMNVDLIKCISEHEAVDQAWYFNRSVYGKTKAGKRYKFDLFDKVEDIINTDKGHIKAK